jgi:hemolysin D
MSAHLRLLALKDLGARYFAHTAFHWRQRNAVRQPTFSAEEAEFLPASLALIERPVSPTLRMTGLLVVSLVVLGIVWAVWAQMDIVVTAEGKVIPTERTKTIASIEVASVRAIFVTEGQVVKAGDPLIQLDARAVEAEEHKASADVIAARLDMARSRALIMAIERHRPPTLAAVPEAPQAQYEEARSQLNGQYLDYLAKLAQLDGEISRYSKALPFAKERAQNYQDLAKTHDVPGNASSEKLQAVIDLEGQLLQAQNARASLIAQTRRQALDALTEAEKVVSSATQDEVRAASHAGLLTLRAPVNGTVQQLTVHTVGGVVPAAQPLMVIVPEKGPVEIESFLDNKDVGFVREGQPAAVKVNAFDYTKHGMVRGRVVAVSRDAIETDKREALYEVAVSLEQSHIMIDGRPVALTPGMKVLVEIKTGSRRVIEYLLSPLMRHQHESLNER